MTDHEARRKIFDRLCREYKKDPDKWLSCESLCGELNLTEYQYKKAVDWMSPISGRVGGRMIIETTDAGRSLHLGPTGRKWCKDGTWPSLLN